MMSDSDSSHDIFIPQTLLTHLGELRRRLMWCFVAMAIGTIGCYLYVTDIYSFLVQPLADAMGPGDTQRLIYTSLGEAFLAYIKVALFAGIFLTFPILATQMWRFLAPGLYKAEKRVVLPFLIATPVLFFMGGAMVYYLILPLALPFFLSFQSVDTALPIQLEARVADYLELVMTLVFAFGLCFQLPVVMMALARFGQVTAQGMRRWRRYVLIIIFIIAAIVTPPDVISQTSLAIPMYLLYEITILLVAQMERARASKALYDPPPPP
ncbi:MAG: twin-arginine translocase subunit TatC [Pseudomonadota bacterium]